MQEENLHVCLIFFCYAVLHCSIASSLRLHSPFLLNPLTPALFPDTQKKKVCYVAGADLKLTVLMPRL